jgi:hypothetical protein
MDELHKAYFNDDAKLYATCAGRVEMASELEPMFIFNIKELPRRSHGMISEALNVESTVTGCSISRGMFWHNDIRFYALISRGNCLSSRAKRHRFSRIGKITITGRICWLELSMMTGMHCSTSSGNNMTKMAQRLQG